MKKPIIILLTVIVVFLFFKESKTERVIYVPCATNAKDSGFSQVETSREMIGGDKIDQLFVAAEEGSFINPKSGLNYIVAGSGADTIYFNMVSIKIIDKKITVVENFDPKKDKLEIFVPQYFSLIEPVIKHSKFEGKPVTYVEFYDDQDSIITAIALLGDVNIKAKDIILKY